MLLQRDPLTFREYLAAMGEEALSHIVDGADPDHPLDEPFHRRLVEHVKGYQLVGGMPAVVRLGASPWGPRWT
jgi:predicted AAA+ superfamily ATPase